MPKKPDQRLLKLYDCYARGQISRRSFMQQAAAIAENMVSDTFRHLFRSLLPEYVK